MGEDEFIKGHVRFLIGAAGGLVSVGSKYVGQDHAYMLRMLDSNQTVKIYNLLIGYSILTPVLVVLGVIIALCVTENNRLKLLALAVSAPALITTWAGGSSAQSKIAFDFVSSAFAQTASQQPATAPSVIDGIKLFFGIGKDESRYRVVVGSFKQPADASQLIANIKSENPNLVVSIASPAPGNAYFGVIVGDYQPYPQAAQVLAKVKSLNSVKDAYLAPEGGFAK